MLLVKAHKELTDIAKGKVLVSEPLSKYTTFKIGGPADLLVIPKDTLDLKNIIFCINNGPIPKFVLGGGSNVLVRDEGFRGVVIKLSSNAFKQLNLENKYLRAGAGVSTGELLSFCVDSNISGLEFISGIPGTVGGLVMMNAGVKERNISDVIEEVVALDKNGDIKLLKKSDMKFGYRSFSPSNLTIIEARFRVFKRESADIVNEINKYASYKRRSQDLRFPSAGCIFKNPKSGAITAGELIERAGLKGSRFGGAEVSSVHANFIINTGSAKASDVIHLMDIVKAKIKKDYDIELEPEIVILNKTNYEI
jgi:UDP-N-acetylmuramate dehydrogenase